MQVVLDPWIRRGDYGPARDGTPTTPSTVGPIPSKGAILPPPAAAAHVGSAMAPTTAAAAAAATVGTISPKDSRGQRTNEHNAAFCGASEEEVRPSAVDRGTSTIGRTASVVAAGANADAGAGPSVGGNEIFSRNVVGSVPRDSPAAQRYAWAKAQSRGVVGMGASWCGSKRSAGGGLLLCRPFKKSYADHFLSRILMC